MSCPTCGLGQSSAGLEASALASGDDLYNCPCGTQYCGQLGWAVDHPESTNAKWRRAARRAVARGQANIALSADFPR